MCGILGSLGKVPFEIEASTLKHIGHRGPDGQGFIKQDAYRLGHVRLAITGGREGQQPLQDDEGNAIVFNGEIYNFKELQAKYLHSDYQSDTRVLFELLKLKGGEILPELRGMFAFAFVSRAQRLFLLARDFFGMKPLFYRRFEDGLIFCSELKPLAQIFDAKTSFDDLEDWLVFQNLRPGRTIYSEIEALRPGFYLQVQDGFEVRPYLKLGQFLQNSEPAQPLHEIWGSVLKRHLPPHIDEFLVLLSSGLDSTSVLTGLASEPGVSSLTLKFKSERLDESMDASNTARALLLPHRTHQMPAFSEEMVCSFLEQMDTPLADPSWFPTLELMKAAGKTHKVAFSGDGGDELFQGYSTFRAEGLHSLVPDFAKSLISSSLKFLGRPSKEGVRFREKLMRFGWGLEEPALMRHSLYLGTTNLVPQKLRWQNDLHQAMLDEDCNPKDPLEPVYFYYFRIYLDKLLIKADRSSMRAGIEVRCPFLDLDILKNCFRPKNHALLLCEPSKMVLRQYLSERLPKHLLQRPKKGFSPPLHELLNCLYSLTLKKRPEAEAVRPLVTNSPYLAFNLLLGYWFNLNSEALTKFARQSANPDQAHYVSGTGL